MSFLVVILILLAVVVLWVIFAYNSLVTLRNRCKEAWSDIDVQLKRRYNLIPNLVETVKGYAKHERELFEKVTQARAQAIGASSIQEQVQAENMLSSALKSLFAVAENYPTLQASANFLELQRELRDTEDKIQASRRFYNGNVRDFNTKIETIPANVVANIFKFQHMDLFEIEDDSERENISVKF